MMRKRYQNVVFLAGCMCVLLILLIGCAEAPMYIQQALGRGIAEEREGADQTACPKITTFVVSPMAVKCAGQVNLQIAAVSPKGFPLNYSWEIEGQTFETGQHAVWKTPTSETVGDPEKAFTVRGVVSDGQCSITQAAEVTVLCAAAFDSRVHFEFGKSKLDSTAKVELDKLGEKLQENPEQAVLIDGHTDYVGTEPANDRLGERRAEVVRKYLGNAWNISPNRVITRSFGENQPLASNVLDTGRAQNRRAEMFRVILSTK